MSKKVPKAYMYSMLIPQRQIRTAIEDVNYYAEPDQIVVQTTWHNEQDFYAILFPTTKATALLLERHFETDHGFKTKANKVKEAQA